MSWHSRGNRRQSSTPLSVAEGGARRRRDKAEDAARRFRPCGGVHRDRAAHDLRVLQATNGRTLITCFPFSCLGSAPDRFIVRARETEGPRPVFPQETP